MNNELVFTERPDNIFYCDIFRLNSKGCLVFGNGKSKAFENVVKDEDKIAFDFGCITSDENNIYGHFEIEFRSAKLEDPINNRIKLDYFVRMLNEEETKYILKCSDKVKEISITEFINLSEFHITCKNSPIHGMINDPSKMNDFRNIIGNLTPKCIIVPWCDSIEEKSELLKKYIN